jgi:hypothetical protein
MAGAGASLLLRLIEQAIARRNETGLGLIEKAVDSGRYGLLELIGYALDLDDLKTWQVLAEAIVRNDSRALRRLERAMAQRNFGTQASGKSLFGRIRDSLTRTYYRITGKGDHRDAIRELAKK